MIDNVREVGRRSYDKRRRHRVIAGHTTSSRTERYGVRHAVSFLNGLKIICAEQTTTTTQAGQYCRSSRGCAGLDHEHAFTVMTELASNLLFDALANANHQHDCHNPNNSAEHGQETTSFRRFQALVGQLEVIAA